MAGGTTKKRFQSWQLTGKGKIVGVYPIADGQQPDGFTELTVEGELVVGVKEFFDGHKDPLVRKPAYDAKKRLSTSEYNDPTTGLAGKNSYEYDERGCLCARQEVDPKGSLRNRIEVRCDPQGRFAEEKLLDRDRKLLERHVFKYDARGNVVRDEKHGAGGKLEGFHTLSYDAKDRITRRAWHGADGNEKNAFTYVYDSHDRRTEIAVETGGARTMVTKISFDERGKRRSTEFLDGQGVPIAEEKRGGEKGRQKNWKVRPPPAKKGPKTLALLEGRPLMEIANITPEHVRALTHIAYSYFVQGRFAQAQGLYESLALLDPKDPAHPAGAGASALSQELPQVAALWYDRALTRSPTHLPSLMGRAEVHLQLGNVDQALGLYKVAFQMAKSPDDPAIRRARALVTAISQAAAKKK